MNLEALLGLLQNQNLENLSKQIGGTADSTKNGILAAVPALLSALNKTSSTPEGAKNLNNALTQHDGSVLNNVEGYLQNPDLKDGAGILNHLFGNNTQNVANAISQSSGLDTKGSLKILETLAPLVLGALGQQKKENNLDAQGISNLTSNLSASFSGDGGIMNMITNLLDTNKDGNVVDDLTGMIGKFLGGNK
ncbi:DUF937 domain-containing protein [Leptotrichia sp. oral taxon 847]|uniref:DUF937 domain-containing protein n=1 Tax=Leptotrichia sp. oral taxon 847 TaxID=1785996 RepID=UPI000767E71F|nr:DUF937 domain-containing protein [Leptotrichia sp. oral taxon 847]AMD95042.1 hypothetical protein AXF11_05255 [Leptotrichia sp. oral taxon 847]